MHCGAAQASLRGSVFVRYPQQHLSVIILSNRNDPEPYRMALSIARH